MTSRFLAHGGTLPGVLERAPRTALSLLDDGTRLTYKELLDAARTIANALTSAGIGEDETVGVRLPNGGDWAIAAYGILCAGARVVPINTRYTDSEAADIITRSGCRLVITEKAAATPPPPALLGPPAPSKPTASFEPLAVFEAAAVPEVWSVSELLASGGGGAETDRRMRGLHPGRISHVQYTSGATGLPKGVLLRHGGLVETTRGWVANTGLRGGDRYPVVAPFAHIGGHKTGLLACAVAGATALPQPVLDPKALARTVAEHGVTVLQGPPALFQALLAEPDMPVGRVRVAVTGAAVVPPALVHRLREQLGIPHVFTGYGLTEASGVCTMTRWDDPVAAVAETSGKPVPGVEVRLAAADGPGEILVRGPGLMAGYLDDPEATAAAFTDGWLRTGDLGEWDGEGRLRVVDRLKDLLIVGGLNVSPAEVEHVLTGHPGVGAAAVVGVPHERLGEVPAAFVVGDAGAEELVAYCAERLAGFKVPRTLWHVAELPLNGAGKVDKPRLRREAGRRSSGTVPNPRP
ncbi:AMP-binding protein [Actinocorallia libanotica]|uniref:FadD3 family acyl-CoA ligase n=1 Tax=Actinocorallia libanotica TaxID=46162 RepID=A0ABP4C1T1_9ACTN